VDPPEAGFRPGRLNILDSHFARYVDSGQLAGWQIVVTRRGEVVHTSTYGLRDVEAGAPVTPDTLWRVYSMTKPITSVAAMMLWEEGRFELTDEVSRYLPEFAEMRVFDKGSVARPYTIPATEPVRIWHLLTHTAGLTYGFSYETVVDALYRAAGYDVVPIPGQDLAAVTRGWAKLPLLYQPGSAWSYGVATDVVGRLIEVVAGQSLDEFIAQRIFEPLKMADARWWVDEGDAGRLAALYTRDQRTGLAVRADTLGSGALRPPEFVSGGGGLICSAADYHRFTQMMLRGGELEGVRLLGRRTIGFMTRNQLPGTADLGTLSTGGFAETTLEGIGFGLGFAVVDNPVPSRTPTTEGTYYWGGMASTAFFVDPAEELTVLLFTQLIPSSAHPLRPQLRQLVYSALA
jgi:CubicO group peptidase (beta-lactamase class C family)